MRLAQKSLPHLRLCNDVLVFLSTERIMRGYRFERTPYKGLFYLWRIMMPLYRPPPPVLLEYGTRISNGDRVELSREEPEATAQTVAKIISGDLPKIDHIRDPEDFFHHISWMIGNDRPNVLLDIGLTGYLTGHFDLALTCFEQLAARAIASRAQIEANRQPEPLKSAAARKDARWRDRAVEFWNERLRAADDLMARLKSNPASITERIEIWEAENIERLRLAETMSRGPTAA